MAEKIGVVKVCPACGASIESFQTRCPSCGHELSDIKTSETVQMFFQRLEDLADREYNRDIEREQEDKYMKTMGAETHKKIGFGTVLLWLFFFWILWVPIIFRKAKGPHATAMAAFGVIALFSLLMIYSEVSQSTAIASGSESSEMTEETVETQLSDTVAQTEHKGLPVPVLIGIFVLSIIGAGFVFVIMKPKWKPEDKRRQSMIDMFPIPNSKEDLTEFIILATDRIKPVSPIARAFNLQAKRQLEWNNIWIAKCNQVYKKARIAMKDDPAGLNTISEMMAEAGLKTARSGN
jgi:hypothetical protein